MTFFLYFGYLTAQGVDCHQVVFFLKTWDIYIIPQRLDCHHDIFSLLWIFNSTNAWIVTKLFFLKTWDI